MEQPSTSQASGPATAPRFHLLALCAILSLGSAAPASIGVIERVIAQAGTPVRVGGARGGVSGGGGATGRGADVRTIAIWSGALIGLLVVGALGLVLLRRRILGNSEIGPGQGLSLHDLRTLRERGEMSEAEFESAKAAVLGQPPGILRAREGYDLTGEPLPARDEREPPGPS